MPSKALLFWNYRWLSCTRRVWGWACLSRGFFWTLAKPQRFQDPSKSMLNDTPKPSRWSDYARENKFNWNFSGFRRRILSLLWAQTRTWCNKSNSETHQKLHNDFFLFSFMNFGSQLSKRCVLKEIIKHSINLCENARFFYSLLTGQLAPKSTLCVNSSNAFWTERRENLFFFFDFDRPAVLKQMSSAQDHQSSFI